MTILSKILNYESSIFEEYSSKRKDLIDHIKSVSNLDNSQLLIFVNDLKAIIDPIKSSISAIDFYFSNTDFRNNESEIAFKKIKDLYFLFLLTSFTDSEEALDTEISESVSEPESEISELVSESKSSRSVSVTFSSTNLLEKFSDSGS